MKIGFIGLGQMGSGVAANLIKAGHEVTVYNRTPAKAQALVAKGAHAATQVADACHGDVVISMLADDSAVEKIALSANGVVASLRENKIHISMSTISIALSERLAAALRRGWSALRCRTRIWKARSRGGRKAIHCGRWRSRRVGHLPTSLRCNWATHFPVWRQTVHSQSD